MNGYFYIDNLSKQQCGPFSLDELRSKNIRPETMIWYSGMTDWAPAGTLPELAHLFEKKLTQSEFDLKEATTTNPIANNSNKQHEQQTTSNPQNGQYNNPSPYGNKAYSTNTYNQSEVRPMPKNWLVESILVTIFCCWPFGIAGIIAANKVDSLYYMGDYDSSERASRNAKKWTLIGFFITIGLITLYFLFFFVVGIISAL